MMTAEVAALAASDEGEFPFKKMSIWFEDLELRVPEKLDSRGNAMGGSSDAVFNCLDEGDQSKTEIDVQGKLYPYECRL